jgi:hypothetical protein
MRCRKAALICLIGIMPALASRAGNVVAVPMPDPQVPGYHFPESEATVLTWVQQLGSGTASSATAFQNLNTHGWGLWTALTMPTSQVDGREQLRTFETWYTPQEIDIAPGVISKPPQTLQSLGPRRRSTMGSFVQFEHGLEPRDRELLAQTNGGSETVFGYVKFDPTAADHVLKQGLLNVSTLNLLMAGGASQIPVFPNTALTLKSAFQIISAKDLVDGRYYRLNAWSGPPATARAWGPDQWPGVVWVDIRGGGSGSGDLDLEASTDGGSRTDSTTYPVSDFINHRMSSFEAEQFNLGQPGSSVAAGDYAILVAMHVAGREISRWTWQTFWWSATPDNPQAPSSQAVAELRPSQLVGAPRHYAMALGYGMLAPDQPAVGGQNEGAAQYTYNPYLEARFGTQSLPDSVSGSDPTGAAAPNNVGVQCNCMSCHIRANYNPSNLATAPRYAGARYTSLDDPQFAGTLQVDLLWSLPELAK